MKKKISNDFNNINEENKIINNKNEDNYIIHIILYTTFVKVKKKAKAKRKHKMLKHTTCTLVF